MDREVLSSIAEGAAREVFDVVAKERQIYLKDLEGKTNLETEEVHRTLNQLQNDGLVKVREAPWGETDFNSVLITSKGLTAQSKLERLS